ncbi:hypothetical protein Hanom_Chr12g01123701 [Helianthus anomalus]
MASTTHIVFFLLITLVFSSTLQTTAARRLSSVPGVPGLPSLPPFPGLPTPSSGLPTLPLPSFTPSTGLPTLPLPPFNPSLPNFPFPIGTPSIVPPLAGIFTPPVAGSVHP